MDWISSLILTLNFNFSFIPLAALLCLCISASLINSLLLDQNKYSPLNAFHIPKIGGSKARAIANALKINSSLERIHLGSNRIGNKGARATAKALRVNSALREIRLYDNYIGDDGALTIAESMEFNSCLQDVYLGGCEIGSEIFELAEPVEFCLQNINLSKNGVGEEILHLIDRALEGCRNRRKRNYRLWTCSFIAHLRAVQNLNFDNHMFAFYFYPLLGIALTE